MFKYLCNPAIKTNHDLQFYLAGWQQKKAAGGANRDRTDDLYNAIVALSQLSYGPTLDITL